MVETGIARDGLVEIMEQDDPERFFVAMQFHPEMMSPEHPEFRKLFRAFVDACIEYHGQK